MAIIVTQTFPDLWNLSLQLFTNVNVDFGRLLHTSMIDSWNIFLPFSTKSPSKSMLVDYSDASFQKKLKTGGFILHAYANSKCNSATDRGGDLIRSCYCILSCLTAWIVSMDTADTWHMTYVTREANLSSDRSITETFTDFEVVYEFWWIPKLSARENGSRFVRFAAVKLLEKKCKM